MQVSRLIGFTYQKRYHIFRCAQGPHKAQRVLRGKGAVAGKPKGLPRCGSPGWTQTNVPAVSSRLVRLFTKKGTRADDWFLDTKNRNKFCLFRLGSPSWARTNDPAVNSRMLYRLSYRGIYSLFSLLPSTPTAVRT